MENKIYTPQGDGNVILETATQMVVQLSDGSFTIIENKPEIGDLVRVRDNAEGFQWMFGRMRKCIGQVGKIVGKIVHLVLVRFLNGDEYHYKPASLELAQENFANGTLVRIVRKVDGAAVWVDEMDPLIGQVGRVVCSRGSSQGPIYNVQFPDVESWWFDGPCLEAVGGEFEVRIGKVTGRMHNRSTDSTMKRNFLMITSAADRANWPWDVDAEELSMDVLGYYEDGGFPYCKTPWDALCLAYAAEKAHNTLNISLGTYDVKIMRGAASFEVGCTTITKEQVNEIYEWINK